jgi:DNA-directed RNA polymerase sigma subunit (sigma70/sigma32)
VRYLAEGSPNASVRTAFCCSPRWGADGAQQVNVIATTLAVKNKDVVDMNRRMAGDASLNASIRDDEDSGEWQDYLVDESPFS